MIRIILAFVILAAIIGFGITAFRQMNGKERWDLTKTVVFSLVCSILSICILVSLVVLF
jgi:hypothetical protein